MTEEIKKKRIAILGSSGSIGTQALEVIEDQSHLFQVEVLTVYKNAEVLIKQAKKFRPNAVVIVDETKYSQVNEALYDQDITVYSGVDALEQVVEYKEIDVVFHDIHCL